MRVFPLSNWTELDIWQYILREGIEIVPLYFAAPRPTVERDGLHPDGRRRALPARAGRGAGQTRSVRFRTLGCYPLSGAVESEAATIEEIVAGNAARRPLSERAGPGRSTATAATRRMEKKKQEGYF